MKSQVSPRDAGPAPVALVSGATGAIGYAICRKLAADGMHIIMLGRDGDKLRDAKARLLREGDAEGGVWEQVIDICDPASVESATADIYRRTPVVDLLVHAAGCSPAGDLLSTTEAMWDETLQSKLMGTIRLTRAVGKHMVQARSGHIVIINGVFCLEVDPMFPVNCTVNAGLSGFAKACSRDLARHGVRVNVVNPGATASPLWDSVLHDLARTFDRSPEQINAQVMAKIPLGRLATPEDIAGMTAFLASPAASYINGAAFSVDGGATSAI